MGEQSTFNLYKDKPLSDKVTESENMIREYYLNDPRPFVLAYSAGKDSNVIMYLAMNVLIAIRNKGIKLRKKITIVTSDTLAELPPMLKQIRTSLEAIRNYAKLHDLPVDVFEVHPEIKNTLNVQLLGVGMPPPNGSFRWCTDKLKKMPTDFFIVDHFGDRGFITITGARRAESFDRASALVAMSRPGTDLKFNSRYKEAANLTPIEHWTVKDVWSYLFAQGDTIVDATVLWDLYSDASGKTSDECSFVGAGGKEIDEGKIGCGVSRFGCWQCYLTRDEDKALGGLLKSGHDNIELYVEYRNWFWKLNQRGWDLVRDVYAHNTYNQTLYSSGGIENIKFGMTRPRGLRLPIRVAAFKKYMELQSRLPDTIITIDEIIEIQRRWLLEGDLNLSAIRVCAKYGKLDDFIVSVANEFQPIVDKAILIINNDLKDLVESKRYSTITIQRMAAQLAMNKNISKHFYPTIAQEKKIRQQWKDGKMNVEDQIEAMMNGMIKIKPVNTLFGKGIDRDKIPEHLHIAANKYIQNQV
jgi:DNA sulfur modification protein DndC